MERINDLAFENPLHTGRLVLLQCHRDAFAEVFVGNRANALKEIDLLGSVEPRKIYLLDELGKVGEDGDVFNLPIIFLKEGTPWLEANSYLLNLVRNKSLAGRPTDDLRRRASKLVDYLLYCEREKIDWRDFSAKRPTLRPTYKYFASISNNPARSAAVVNQYTYVVYSFYEYYSTIKEGFDLSRVDSVKEIKLVVSNAFGTALISTEKRSQTLRTSPASVIPMGYILEDGELLRPLSNIEYDEFKMIVSGKLLVRERLMVQIAVASGARKQSILTIRLKNLSAFEKSKKLRDGTFLLLAGPGTGIDTKNGTRQKLYIPSQLAEEILVYAGSPEAKRRRSKFRHKYAKEFPDLREMPEEDFYLFLSDQGGEFYMGKDDPRYPRKKSRPIGQVTNGLQKKIFSMGSELIPLDFTFHWLRATFAFHLYQRLMPLIESGHLNLGEEISLIQKRMHHMRRETTENYLKLFNMRFERLEAQEKYEDYLFGSHGVDLRK